jgi:hypothetical protein
MTRHRNHPGPADRLPDRGRNLQALDIVGRLPEPGKFQVRRRGVGRGAGRRYDDPAIRTEERGRTQEGVFVHLKLQQPAQALDLRRPETALADQEVDAAEDGIDRVDRVVGLLCQGSRQVDGRDGTFPQLRRAGIPDSPAIEEDQREADEDDERRRHGRERQPLPPVHRPARAESARQKPSCH